MKLYKQFKKICYDRTSKNNFYYYQLTIFDRDRLVQKALDKNDKYVLNNICKYIYYEDVIDVAFPIEWVEETKSINFENRFINFMKNCDLFTLSPNDYYGFAKLLTLFVGYKELWNNGKFNDDVFYFLGKLLKFFNTFPKSLPHHNFHCFRLSNENQDKTIEFLFVKDLPELESNSDNESSEICDCYCTGCDNCCKKDSPDPDSDGFENDSHMPELESDDDCSVSECDDPNCDCNNLKDSDTSGSDEDSDVYDSGSESCESDTDYEDWEKIKKEKEEKLLDLEEEKSEEINEDLIKRNRITERLTKLGFDNELINTFLKMQKEGKCTINF